MVKYYLREIEQKSALQEPVFLYHHPGHRHWDVLENIFRKVKERGIPTLSLREYAEWWRQRSAIQWAAEYEQGKIKLNSNNVATSFRVRVNYPNGKSILLPLNGDETEGKELPASSINHLQYNPTQLRKYNWHMLLTDIFWMATFRRQVQPEESSDVTKCDYWRRDFRHRMGNLGPMPWFSRCQSRNR